MQVELGRGLLIDQLEKAQELPALSRSPCSAQEEAGGRTRGARQGSHRWPCRGLGLMGSRRAASGAPHHEGLDFTAKQDLILSSPPEADVSKDGPQGNYPPGPCSDMMAMRSGGMKEQSRKGAIA
jgi:hypothetical protein